MFKILVVEDDKNIRRLVSSSLRGEGYLPSEAADGISALELFENEVFDLVITDIMMPKEDGLWLCRRIRDLNEDIPILILTAKAEVEDKKTGFLRGADDYMVKPFDIDEMILRVRALLRRAKNLVKKKLEIGRMVLNYDDRAVTVDLNFISLPPKEFLLLFKFLASPGIIFTKIQLMDEFWGIDNYAGDRTIDVHISRIRQRFEAYGIFEIVNVKGLGYKGVIVCNEGG